MLQPKPLFTTHRPTAAAVLLLLLLGGLPLWGENAPDPAAATLPSEPPKAAVPATNPSVRQAWEFFTGTNATLAKHGPSKQSEDFETRLRIARSYRLARQFKEATDEYAGILEGAAPGALQRTALLELAEMAQDQGDLSRAQQVYAQWLARWPQDAAVPEVLLREGLVYRQMGLANRAIAKFYAVMTSALVLKPERFEYYQQLVLRAQNEIAETQFQQGNYEEAGDFRMAPRTGADDGGDGRSR